MAQAFTLEVEGADKLQVVVSRWEQAISDIAEIEQPIYAYLRKTMGKQFVTQGAYVWHRWEALSLKYASWKQRHYPGRTVLYLTGRLRRSLTKPGADTVARRLSRTQLEFGSTVPYAMYHQLGTRKMPQRKIIDFTRREAEGIVRIWQRRLLQLRDQGLRLGSVDKSVARAFTALERF